MAVNLDDAAWTRDHFLYWLDRELDPIPLEEVANTEAVLNKLRQAISYYDKWTGDVHEAVLQTTGDAVEVQPPVGTVKQVYPSQFDEPDSSIEEDADFTFIRLFGNRSRAAFSMDQELVRFSAIYDTFRRHFSQMSDDEFDWQQEQGRLLFDNFPRGADSVLVRYYPTYSAHDPDLEIVNRESIDWIRRYMKALAFRGRGNVLKRTQAQGVDVGGDSDVSFGTENKDALEEELEQRAVPPIDA